MIRCKRKWQKGELSRTLVVYCVRVMTLTLVWAVGFKTVCALCGTSSDLSDVLGFAGAFFGGELILLAFKRICCKKEEQNESSIEEACEP